MKPFTIHLGPIQACFVLFGLWGGNFFYAWLHAHNWAHAFEQSYFQLVALATAWIVSAVARRVH